MSNGGIVDISTGAAQAVGRYFSVISVIPSALYVVFVYLLIASGSWTHSPNWERAFTSLEHISIGGIGALVFLSIGLGLVIHPIQFALVQFLEGYWGTARFAQFIRAQRILRYQRLCEDLDKVKAEAIETLHSLPEEGADYPVHLAQLTSRRGEAARILDNFPRADSNIMPTRLGNMLRRYESQSGVQYGMDALQAVPHLLLIAPPNHVEYVNDQRSQLDLTVRFTFISLAASATAVFFMWPYGFWILIAAIPYMLAYLTYRGAVVAAGHYGSSFDTLINLDRFLLYEQLHLPLPVDTNAERLTNEKMKGLFEYGPANVEYKHPEPGSGAEAATKLGPASVMPQAWSAATVIPGVPSLGLSIAANAGPTPSSAITSPTSRPGRSVPSATSRIMAG